MVLSAPVALPFPLSCPPGRGFRSGLQRNLETWGRLSMGADKRLPLRPAPQSASPPHLVLLATPAAQLRGPAVVGVWCMRWIRFKDSFGGFHRRGGQRGKQSLKLEAKNYMVSRSQVILFLSHLVSCCCAKKGLKWDDALKSWGQCLTPRKPSVKGSCGCLWYPCTHHHLHQFTPHPLSSVHFLSQTHSHSCRPAPLPATATSPKTRVVHSRERMWWDAHTGIR